MSDQRKVIKCVVWDLDNTVWDGILLEDQVVQLRAGVVETIKGLDERGILCSVASRNEPEPAMAKLEEFGLAEYMLHPQIGWGAKSTSIRNIADAINLGTDTFVFIDDQHFERDEVNHDLPEVLCLDVDQVPHLLKMDRAIPRFVTDSSRQRRSLYQAEARRADAEKDFGGPSGDFLATLGMKMTIAPASEIDLRRAEELTVRTNQLNATGYTYSHDELDSRRRSEDHDLLIASLDDMYGSYGQIGLALTERQDGEWTIKLLLMSCRVMSRGVGTILLQHVIRAAQSAGVALRAEFVPTDRNRAMFVTYKFAGFREVARWGGRIVMEHDGEPAAEVPPHIDLEVHSD